MYKLMVDLSRPNAKKEQRRFELSGVPELQTPTYYTMGCVSTCEGSCSHTCDNVCYHNATKSATASTYRRTIWNKFRNSIQFGKKMTEKIINSRDVYITTNYTCNLRCVYCYEHDKLNQETFDLERTKQTLSQVLHTKTEHGTIIDFHGGEPFLSYKKIRELCEWAWNQDFPEKFTFFATTNGTLIHGEIKDWLLLNRDRFVVGLSLDGTREMHNANRSNSYDNIDLNFFFKTWPKQGVKMTISPKTIGSLSEGIIDMHEKGCGIISANLSEMTDWSSPEFLDVYRRELAKLAVYYMHHPEIEKCSLFKVHFPALLNPEVKKWCGVGTNMESIDVDGKKYPCHLFFESVCGKAKSEKSHYIDFSDPDNYISSHCRKCALLKICPTCYGSNYIARGDIALRDLSLCELNKVRFAEVAKYEYTRIVDDAMSLETLSNEEKFERLRILEAIESITEVLKL